MEVLIGPDFQKFTLGALLLLVSCLVYPLVRGPAKALTPAELRAADKEFRARQRKRVPKNVRVQSLYVHPIKSCAGAVSYTHLTLPTILLV